MNSPRRRLVRSTANAEADGAVQQRQLHRLRARLEQERLTLTRWVRRLKRAFHAFEKGIDRVSRLERKFVTLQGGSNHGRLAR